MSSIERAIWQAFQVDPPDRLGDLPVFSGYDEVTIRWEGRSEDQSPVTGMKQIDGIVKSNNAIWVCEVKEVLNYESFGQAYAYAGKYKESRNAEKPVFPCVVFARIDGRTIGLAEAAEQYTLDISFFHVEDIPRKMSENI
jgi:hypothetical protein